MTDRVLGKDLRVGDTIECWWTPGRDTVVELIPYQGVYKDTVLRGARIGLFAIMTRGMTIEADADFNVIARGA